MTTQYAKQPEALPETLERHWLCKIVEEGVTVYKVLCLKCRHAQTGFKRVSFSELPCENCGVIWRIPPGAKAIKCKDYTVTITARYPDLESAKNSIL
jgi:hypothetical protein